MVDKERKNILIWILPMTIIVINLLLNIRYIFRVLVLDDLYYWGLYKSMSPSEFILNTWANKFRPIYNLIQYVIYELVGKNYYILWWINIILNIIVALVIFYFAYKIADNLWIAWGGALLYSVSRFAYYQITQVFGVMETLGLLCAVSILYLLYQYIWKQNIKLFYWALILWICVSFIHERYMMLLPIFIIANIDSLWSKELSIIRKAIGFVSLCLVFTIIFVIRMLVLGNSGMTGTGGTEIFTDFNVMQVLYFIALSIMYLLGINFGHPAMVMVSLNRGQYGILYTIIAISAACCVLVIMITFICDILKNKYENWNKIKVLLLFLSFIGINIISTSVTIRVELRWMYTPYVGMILMLIFICSKMISYKKISSGILLIYIVFTVVFNIHSRQYFNNLYFWSTITFAESLYDETIGKYGDQIWDKPIVLLKSENQLPFIDEAYLKTIFSQFGESKADSMDIKVFEEFDKVPEELLNDIDIILLQSDAEMFKITNIRK